MADLTPDIDAQRQIIEQVASLAARLGVEPIPKGAGVRGDMLVFVEGHHLGRSWSFSDLLMALLDRLDEVERNLVDVGP